MSSPDGRRHDIDALRVMSFGTLIIYHTSLIYGTRSWHLNTDEPSRLIDLIHVGSHPWRMSLLFFISGMVTAALLNKRTIEEIRSARTRQLLLPFLFGVVVVVPPQIYFSKLLSVPDLSYWDFMRSYLDYGMPLEHMWFLAYLWIYVFVWSIIWPRIEKYRLKLSSAFAASLTGAKLFVLPISFLAVLRLSLYPIFGESLIISNDFYAHTLYFSMFVAGSLLMNQSRFWQEIDKQRWISLGLAAFCFAALAIIVVTLPHEQRPAELVFVLRIVRSIFQWCMMIALLAFAARWLNRPSRLVSYLNRSIMTYYVVHQTVIVAAAYCFAKAGILDIRSFVPIVVITLIVSAFAAEAKKQAANCSSRLLAGFSMSSRTSAKLPPPEAVG
jgi:glucans biosynthesis protein C